MITKNSASQSLIVRPSGDLDGLSAEHLRQGLRPLLAEGYRFLIFDLEEVEYITSSGLGLLVELFNTLIRTEGSLRLINCHDRVHALLRQSKLDTIFISPEGGSSASGEQTDDIPFDRLHSMMSKELLFCSHINDASERCLKSDDRFEIAKIILEGLVRACGSERAAFFFLDESRQSLDLTVCHGLAKSLVESVKRLDVNADDPFFVQTERYPITFIHEPATESDALADRLPHLLSFDRCALVPIHGICRPLGLVALEDSRRQAEPLDSVGPLLRAYATICGLALEKTHLMTDLKTSNHQLQESLTSVQEFQDTIVDVGKLAALGAVISGLGHLLNNKLVPIIGYSELMAQDVDLPEKTRGQIEVINGAAIELKDVMEKLIKVSRVRDLNREFVDIHKALHKTLTLLGYHIEVNRVRVELTLQDDLPMVLGDHDLLLQAFVAMIHRACTSFDEGRDDRFISISTRNAGATVDIEVTDNGAGLGDLPVEDWLDPLVPYEELGQGRLFNYSIPRSVVRRHRGTIELGEREGGGTVVRISLPISHDEPSTAVLPNPEVGAEVA